MTMADSRLISFKQLESYKSVVVFL